MAAFDELAKGEAPVPADNNPCHWLIVSNDSPAVHQTLSELDIRRLYSVQIQAIRRDGKFIRFPDGSMNLQAGDQLLLCGSSSALNQLQPLISPGNVCKFIPAVPIVRAIESESLKGGNAEIKMPTQPILRATTCRDHPCPAKHR